MLPPLTSTCVSNAARQERIAAAAHQNGAEQKPMIFSSCLFNDPSAPTFYNLEESGEEWQAPKNVASAAAMQSREQRPDLPEPPPLATPLFDLPLRQQQQQQQQQPQLQQWSTMSSLQQQMWQQQQQLEQQRQQFEQPPVVRPMHER